MNSIYPFSLPQQHPEQQTGSQAAPPADQGHTLLAENDRNKKGFSHIEQLHIDD